MSLLLKFLLAVSLLSGCQKKANQVELTSVGALIQDRAASALVKAEKYEEALEIYLSALEKEPQKPQIHSNVGVILSQIQRPEDAVKSLLHALKLAEEQKDGPSLFAINFNLGAYYGAQKNVDEALKHYQAALNILPTSKEAKTNIELLTQLQNQDGKGEGENKDQNQQNQDPKEQKDNKDQKGKGDKQDPNQDQKGENKKDDPKDQKDKDEKASQKKESSGKYKPRPYQGEQLSEGDVKKILGELRNQEQKIRANFDKKEQKDSGNEKDW